MKKIDGISASRGIIDQMAEAAVKMLGIHFPPEELYGLASHTFRKWENTGYGEDYLPILFENELHDFLMRREINKVGRMNYERNLQLAGAHA